MGRHASEYIHTSGNIQFENAYVVRGKKKTEFIGAFEVRFFVQATKSIITILRCGFFQAGVMLCLAIGCSAVECAVYDLNAEVPIDLGANFRQNFSNSVHILVTSS